MIKKVILTSLLTGLFSGQCLAQNKQAFPNSQIGDNNANRCVVVTDYCSFDGTQLCKTEYCGNQIKTLYLKNFIKEHKLKGRKFPSLFDLQSYVKNNLPKELKGMKIHFSYKNISYESYNPNRIIVLLDSKDYISDLIIG